MYNSSGFDRNNNISHPGFVPNSTRLYEVSSTGIYRIVTFVRFEYAENGKEIIYVKYSNEEYFYAYPESIGRNLFKNDADARAHLTKQKSQKDYSKYAANNSTSAYAICNAYKKLPKSHISSQVYVKELKYEEGYHDKVQAKLKQECDKINGRLKDVSDLDYEANRKLKAAIANDKDSDAGFDPFNLDYYFSNKAKEKAKVLERNIYQDLSRIHETQKNPYIARIDCGPNKDDLHTAYIGNKDIGGYVISWANPKIGNAYYHSDILEQSDEIYIALKRIFSINNGVFGGFDDDFNKYVGSRKTNRSKNADTAASVDEEKNTSKESSHSDELLNKLLAESRASQSVHDIIRTIQINQYSIITAPFNRNILVNGCAGSGKTMILYHRLSYIAYNDREFVPSNVYALTPNIWFDALNAELIRNLDIEKINNQPLNTVIQIFISKYATKNRLVCAPYENLLRDNTFDAHLENIYSNFRSHLDELIKYDRNVGFLEWLTSKMNMLLRECGMQSRIPSSEEDILHTPLEVFVRGYSESTRINIESKHTMRSERELKSERLGTIDGINVWLTATHSVEEREIWRGIGRWRKSHKVKYNVWSREIMTNDKIVWKNSYRDLGSILSGCSLDDITASIDSRAEKANGSQKDIISKQRNYISRIAATLTPYLSKVNITDLSEKVKRGNSFWNSPLGSESAYNKYRKLQFVNQSYDALQSYINGSSKKILLILCDYVFEKYMNSTPSDIREQLKLCMLVEEYGALSNEKKYYFIDEFQNYSQDEIELLKCVYPNSVFNLFGDFAQRLDEKGVENTDSIAELFDADIYSINENYRNALEITKFINESLGKSMMPIGLHGAVSEQKNKYTFEMKGRTAIIIGEKNIEFKKKLLNDNPNSMNDVSFSQEIMNNKYNVLSVSESKGLEFETVYVLNNGLSDNEKYVAYTRALNYLVLLT